jgi:hypothetical protein
MTSHETKNVIIVVGLHNPVHLLGKTAAISSKARCLRVFKTECYGARICFEMTRQATMPSLEAVSRSKTRLKKPSSPYPRAIT